jgi:glucose-1-phosphatase
MTHSIDDLQSPARAPAISGIEVLLFDVGGVLVELRGIEFMHTWLGGSVSEEELWARWLQSESVRMFETGRIGADTFAIGVIREFGLAIEPQPFLQFFEQWLVGPYPGAFAMLERIPSRYRRAVLSNSNALQWPRILRDMRLETLFHRHFVSHLTGRIKPDAAAFEHVLAELDCTPEQVLFLDDNQINIAAATQVGLRAIRVRGPQETQQALLRAGIIHDDD